MLLANITTLHKPELQFSCMDQGIVNMEVCTAACDRCKYPGVRYDIDPLNSTQLLQHELMAGFTLCKVRGKSSGVAPTAGVLGFMRHGFHGHWDELPAAELVQTAN